ncbi:hypothetical protein N7539_001002 [Penicillium diatomitis]|uniref:Uncharacterized protein n=1 Tax=Penicillium diatomitis TaxID=2819901 RepID=A0A9W9XMV1_9EURO|nr:uncharacterized protein N7539_001002 [Penicillium diatomitis]KAJ5495886.1 hypothetical protein N7539_001002 [Penicillium diatomitis]
MNAYSPGDTRFTYVINRVEFPFILEYKDLVLQIPRSFDIGFLGGIATGGSGIHLRNVKGFATGVDLGAVLLQAQIGECGRKTNPMPGISPRSLEEWDHTRFIRSSLLSRDRLTF